MSELEDQRFIERVQEQVEGALLEYTLCTSSQYLGRFAQLLLCLSELRSLSVLAENYLSCKYLEADVPCNNLLIEMLHAKHSSWPWRTSVFACLSIWKHFDVHWISNKFWSTLICVCASRLNISTILKNCNTRCRLVESTCCGCVWTTPHH